MNFNFGLAAILKARGDYDEARIRRLQLPLKCLRDAAGHGKKKWLDESIRYTGGFEIDTPDDVET